MTDISEQNRENAIKWLIDKLRIGANIGQSVDQTIKDLNESPFSDPPPEDLMEEARSRFLRQRGLVSSYTDVETMTATEEETGQWYTGPKEVGHIYWPYVKSQIAPYLGDALEDVDKASSKVLASLRPPGESEFDVRGLVLGYVQSGKTTNFVSLIAKAADEGYRLIIVLAGLTDNLRKQTQKRLNEQLIKGTEGWVELTTENTDFGAAQGEAHHTNAKTTMRSAETRMIAVVKKNGHILRKLNEFLANSGELADNCPILIIDDESDQASINVSLEAKQEVSRINAQIRTLLRNRKTAYVAYTATPFANILIDPNNQEDIYPKDFIHVLPKPKGYFGSELIFGREPLTGDEDTVIDGLDMVRDIAEDDVVDTRPPSGKNGIDNWDPKIPPSLESAIQWFILATAARHARGQQNKHSSMLVHTAVRTQAHEILAELIEEHVRTMRTQYKNGKLTDVLERLWADETSRVSAEEFNLRPLSYQEIEAHIPSVLEKVQVVIDNGTSTKRLVYEDKVPLTAIAVGGNTLARGLTLEGLICSYFVRNATAYDTLLQMGRWFGFRNGYQDLPRIWMTEELQSWFRDLALVEADLRQDLSRYAEEGITPMDFQARIRTHPSMEVTAKAKQQNSRPANISYSGSKVQTILFRHRDSEWLNANIAATKELVADIQMEGKNEVRRPNGTAIFRDVSPTAVERFLNAYTIYEGATLGRDGAQMLKKYISTEHETGSIRSWNVSFFGKKSGSTDRSIDLGLESELQMVNRSQMVVGARSDVANIKTLVGSLDRLNAIEIDEETRALIKNEIDQAKAREAKLLRLHQEYSGNDTAQLVIYAIDPESKTTQDSSKKEVQARNKRKDLNAVAPLIGIGIFFPTSDSPLGDVEYITSQEVIDAETQERIAEAEEEIQLVQEPKEDA